MPDARGDGEAFVPFTTDGQEAVVVGIEAEESLDNGFRYLE